VVEIHVQGHDKNIEHFISDLFALKPVISLPKLLAERATNLDSSLVDFQILESEVQGSGLISVPTDLYLCDDCLAEMNDPTDRRYHYPFINCTQCGPRFTIIKSLPYDRPNTSMANFSLCNSCQTEYQDPANRRFHAEPIACPDCGPQLSFYSNHSLIVGNESVLQNALTRLQQGQTIAIKGIGGYHLICDACSDQAVQRLRNNKSRPDKPLAVIFPSSTDEPFKAATDFVNLTESDQSFLLQPARPILLVTKVKGSKLSGKIAAGLNEVGMMLPYSPLHHRLLDEFAGPLVATSANISGEPVLTDNLMVEKRLSHVADGIVHHDRAIVRPADDPVFRTIAGKKRPIRLGRGFSPVELSLPFKLEQPVLAVGAQMKNVIALAWENRAIISPHIGEMSSARSLQVFENTIDDLQALYGVQAKQIICDAHPGYTTTRWAKQQSLPVSSIYHHHAHASASYFESEADKQLMVFTWDGVGFGDDESLWGGETFIGRPANWQRFASLKPFCLPGGDKASRELWRSAAAVCWQTECHQKNNNQQPKANDYYLELANSLSQRFPLVKQAWEQGINSPQTSSIGRFFDAAASITGVCEHASFEGQGPMLLEAIASKSDRFVSFELYNENDRLIADWKPLLQILSDNQLSQSERSSIFHRSLAQLILEQALLIREKYAIDSVSFAGGVFQNKLLVEQAVSLLQEQGFKVSIPTQLPVNDASISFGQIIETGYMQLK